MLPTTRIPAIAPIATAPIVLTNAAEAEIATAPASRPLNPIVGSGLPNRAHIVRSEARQPAPVSWNLAMLVPDWGDHSRT